MISSLSSLLECLSPDTTIATAPQPLEYHVTVEPFLGPSIMDGQYPEFGVHIVDGVVWFWLLEQWQDLPNELWAWKSVTVGTEGHYYHGSRIWVPSLLLFDFWEYDRSSYSRATSPSTIRIASSLALWSPAAVVIASRLFSILRDSGNSKLCRTCRLVCRDWANACSIRDPERCALSFQCGSVWCRIEEEWRYLPSKFWAWTLQCEEWWVDRPQGQWYLELVQPVDDTVRHNPIYSSTLSLLLSPDSTSTRSVPLTGAALPPELFRYICGAADTKSSSCRLVCRYWNRLCTPRVFERVNVKNSPERIRALWRHRTDPVMRYVKLVDKVPRYDWKSTFPWVHLLTQACASTRSVWEDGEWFDRNSRPGGQGKIKIIGPFAGGHRTIRSVHFALPRSLPRSLLRGIKTLYVHDITFRKVEDLAHLVCELPDLEWLYCGPYTAINPDSLPIQLPRRRPRTNRNNLRDVDVTLSDSRRVDPLMVILTVYLSVYDAMSFFSDGEITIILALLKPLYRSLCPRLHYEENHHNHSRRLRTQTNWWSLCFQRDLRQNHTILNFVIDCWNFEKIEELDRWTQFDTEFDKIKSLIRQANIVFGFRDRKRMNEFATNIFENKMPSMSKFATVRYSISIQHFGWDQWYQASLGSEELTGEPQKYLWEVYS